MEKTCAIISGGQYSSLENIASASFIIACDKGLEYALKENVVPDLFVGDCDSVSIQIPFAVNKIILPREKDETDTLYAIKYALNEGYKDFVLYCALGNRLDHTLSNLQCCACILSQGGSVRIVSESCEVYFVDSSKEKIIALPEENENKKYALSVLSYTNCCKGVSIKGAKYELNKALLTNDFPLGISNEFKNEEVIISCEEGILLVLVSAI